MFGIEGKMVNGRSIEMHSNFKEVKIAVAGTTRNHVNSKRTKVHDFDDEGRDYKAVYRVVLRFCSHTVPFRMYTILVFIFPRYIHCSKYRVAYHSLNTCCTSWKVLKHSLKFSQP